MKIQYHIIQKVFVEVNTSQVKTATSIKNNISLFLREKLFPELESVLARYDVPEIVVRLDELNVDLYIQNWETQGLIKSELINRIEAQLKVCLPKAHSEQFGESSFEREKQLSENISVIKNLEEIFLFFLQNGYFPWYGNVKQMQLFISNNNWHKSFEDIAFINKLEHLSKNSEWAYKRFVMQFPSEMIIHFLSQINSEIISVKSQLIHLSEQVSGTFRNEFMHVLFIISSKNEKDIIVGALKDWFDKFVYGSEKDKNKSSKPILQATKIIFEILPGPIIADKRFEQILNQGLSLISNKEIGTEKTNISDYQLKKKLKKRKPKTSSDKEIQDKTENTNFYNTQKKIDLEPPFFEAGMSEISIYNAGLVLLHPFLKHFFRALKITDSKGNFYQIERDLAVQSLHYLATGEENVFEGNLILEKFLCGVPLKITIQKESLLTKEMKDEAEFLLHEAIKNWPALKNTSPDGLRQMFLQRDGKLVLKADKYKLIVERKAQDILKDKLSWNISVFKLPWLKQLITVDW